MFQLESQGMRDTLRKLRPDCFEDIIALIALYRPGPMDNIPSYIDVKNEPRSPSYLHPLLEPILKETYGIIVYQEQVMQIAQLLAGYTLGEADLLRRAMGKKIKAEMDAQRAGVRRRARSSNGIDDRAAGTHLRPVDKFAGYGFNKSHAAAYALLAYQTAWLKANHPVEFFAASMSLDMRQPDKLAPVPAEMRQRRHSALPARRQPSGRDFEVEDGGGTGALRAGARSRRRPAGRMRHWWRCARRSGPFRRPVRLRGARRRQGAQQAAAGEPGPRRRLRLPAPQPAPTVRRLPSRCCATPQPRPRLRTSVARSACSAAAAPPQVPRANLPDVEDWPALERLQMEFEAIGFYLSGHPLDGLWRGAGAGCGITLGDRAAAGRGRGRPAAGWPAWSPASRSGSPSGTRFAFADRSPTPPASSR